MSYTLNYIKEFDWKGVRITPAKIIILLDILVILIYFLL